MEKRAQKHLYRLNQETLSQFEAWVQHMQQRWEERFAALDTVLESEKKLKDMGVSKHSHWKNCLEEEPGSLLNLFSGQSLTTMACSKVAWKSDRDGSQMHSDKR